LKNKCQAVFIHFQTSILSMLLVFSCHFSAQGSINCADAISLKEYTGEIEPTLKHSSARLSENNFATFRPFELYEKIFSDSFYQDLVSLKSSGHWIDMGAGQGVAIQGFYKKFTESESRPSAGSKKFIKVPKITGVVYKSVEKEKWKNEEALFKIKELNWLSGKLIEDISSSVIGRADVISDVQGPIAYTDDLYAVLDKYLKILNKGGKIYLNTYWQLTKVYTKNRQWLNLSEWLLNLEGLKVLKPNNNSLIIQKISSNEIVIPNLYLEYYEDGGPPKRVFSEVKKKLQPVIK